MSDLACNLAHDLAQSAALLRDRLASVDESRSADLDAALSGVARLGEPRYAEAFADAVDRAASMLRKNFPDRQAAEAALNLLADDQPDTRAFRQLAVSEMLLGNAINTGALLDLYRHRVRYRAIQQAEPISPWNVVSPPLRLFLSTLLPRTVVSQPRLRHLLPDEDARALIDKLRHHAASEQSKALQQQIIATSGGRIAQVQQTIVHGDLYAVAPIIEPDVASLFVRYRSFLLDAFRTLDVRGVLQVRHVSRMALADIYVPLTGACQHSTPPRRPERRTMRFGRYELDVSDVVTPPSSAPLHTYVRDVPLIVVLGDPGTGKSTLIRYILLSFANGEMYERLGLSESWLPIFFPIAAFAEARSRSGNADIAPLDYLQAYYTGLSQPDYVPLFRCALERGYGLVLLDGLDEVRMDRMDIVHCIEAFVREWDEFGNRFIATSRIAGYDNAPLDEVLFTRVMIQPLSDDDIRFFVERWSHTYEGAFSSALSNNPTARERQEAQVDLERRVQIHANSLSSAVFADPGITDLARKPLLLTILALIHNQGARLPNRRVDLYRLCVEALAETWNRTRSLSGREINLYLGNESIDERLVVNLLGPAALWIHATQPGGEVEQSDLEKNIADTLMQTDGMSRGQARRLAHNFIELMRHDTGLIQERGYRRFGFIHLTFEEYLAARGLVESVTIPDPDALMHAYVLDPRWREVLRLAVAASPQREAQRILLHLLAAPTTADTRGRPVVLASECLIDIGVNIATQRGWREVVVRLIATLRDPATPLNTRVAGGHTLGQLGDPRVLGQSNAEDVSGETYWCVLEAGDFWYSADQPTRNNHYHNGRNNGAIHSADLQPVTLPYMCWIARYPVTNAEYRRFVDSGGYEMQRWWTPSGWAFLQNGSQPSPLEDETEGPINQPGLWKTAQFNSPAQPVVGVSWYEAVAYCDWLTHIGHREGWLSSTERLRLPTSLEWERAARHTDRRRYPWGDESPDSERANYEAIGLRAPAPVGCFPNGPAVCGAHDLAGNVWEWTATLWEQPFEQAPCREVSPHDRPIIRGGAFNWKADYLECSARYWFNPGYRYNLLGFRVVRVRKP